MSQLTDDFQKLSCLLMFGVELAVPLLIFGSRRLRPAAFFLLAGFQVLILLTGNYCFFNYLTLGLCLWTLEDQAWPGWLRKWGMPVSGEAGPFPLRASFAVKALFIVVLFVTAFQMPDVFRWEVAWPAPLRAVYGCFEPLRSINSYGLFRVMTTSRPEIVVEGSDDGRVWRAYGFKWKPGDLRRGPVFVAPYQPRLDWQMWFAALGDYRGEPWFQGFLLQLLRGSPDVLNLLGDNPFPQHAPRYVRAQLYEYRFTTPTERDQTGDWWKREYKGEYFPAISLKDVGEKSGS